MKAAQYTCFFGFCRRTARVPPASTVILVSTLLHRRVNKTKLWQSTARPTLAA
jgi:hypothetical protein